MDKIESIVSDDKVSNISEDEVSIPNSWLDFDVKISEARNLPLIKSKGRILHQNLYLVSPRIQFQTSQVLCKFRGEMITCFCTSGSVYEALCLLVE